MPIPFQQGDHKEPGRPQGSPLQYTNGATLQSCIVGAGLAPALVIWTSPRPATLLNRLQVQENILDVWIFRGPRSGIGVLRIGPANELGGAVLIPVGFSRQRDAGQLIHHNLLQPIYRLLLHLWVSARSILVQQL